jgi:hypothetical protein
MIELFAANLPNKLRKWSPMSSKKSNKITPAKHEKSHQ